MSALRDRLFDPVVAISWYPVSEVLKTTSPMEFSVDPNASPS
jgi:hypothetical protein